jgi:hypothetical protein
MRQSAQAGARAAGQAAGHMTDRDVRHFAVYSEGRLALVLRAEPGTLRSSAGPPPPAGEPGPPGPPGTTDLPPGVHPFVDADAHDPVSEGRLRELLDASSGFDDYLARLVDAGFDIASVHDGPDYEPGPATRLHDGDGLAGACWPRAGQFTTLAHQPADGELVFECATATAYRETAAPALLDALRSATGFDELLERLAAAGLVRR